MRWVTQDCAADTLAHETCCPCASLLVESNPTHPRQVLVPEVSCCTHLPPSAVYVPACVGAHWAHWARAFVANLTACGSMAEENPNVALFTAAGVPNPAKVANNSKLAPRMVELIAAAGITGNCDDPRVGPLLLRLATKFFVPTAEPAIPVMVKYIMDGSIRLDAQVEAAFKFMKAVPEGAGLNVEALAVACGAGVNPDEAEIEAHVNGLIEANRESLVSGRYAVANGLLRELKAGRMEWADGKVLMAKWNGALTALLGPKTDADRVKVRRGDRPAALVAAPQLTPPWCRRRRARAARRVREARRAREARKPATALVARSRRPPPTPPRLRLASRAASSARLSTRPSLWRLT